MIVQRGEEYNLSWVWLKLTPNDRNQLVIPAALQMGWTNSPPYFRTATETGVDLICWLLAIGSWQLAPVPTAIVSTLKGSMTALRHMQLA